MIAIFVIVLLMMGAIFVVYYQNMASTLQGQDATLAVLQSSVSSLQSHPVVSTSTVTSVSTDTVTNTTNQVTPFAYAEFLIAPNPNSSGIFFDTGWSDNIDQAMVFDCPTFTSTVTCTLQFHDNPTGLNMTITMSYPEVGQANETGWANCAFEITTSPAYHAPITGSGYCIQVTDGYYIIAMPFYPV